MESPEQETELIERILKGERNDFRHLVEAHQDQVYRLCRLLLGQSAAAEDLAQDTFARAYQKLDRFDPTKGRFATWLLTMTRRLCLNTLAKRRPAFSLSCIDAATPEVTFRDEEGPVEQTARSESRDAIDHALSQLSPEHRRIFVLAEVEDLPHEEIAQIEGIAIGTVKSRVSRAKLALRGFLRPHYEALKDLPAN